MVFLKTVGLNQLFVGPASSCLGPYEGPCLNSGYVIGIDLNRWQLGLLASGVAIPLLTI